MTYEFLLTFQGMIRLDFVIDAACVGLEDPIKGHVPVGFVVIDKSTSPSAHSMFYEMHCVSFPNTTSSRNLLCHFENSRGEGPRDEVVQKPVTKNIPHLHWYNVPGRLPLIKPTVSIKTCIA